MTRTVLKVADSGRRFIVTFTTGTNCNPYRIIELYRDGEKQRRRTVEKYQCLNSCLYWLCSVPEFYKDYFVAV